MGRPFVGVLADAPSRVNFLSVLRPLHRSTQRGRRPAPLFGRLRVPPVPEDLLVSLSVPVWCPCRPSNEATDERGCLAATSFVPCGPAATACEMGTSWDNAPQKAQPVHLSAALHRK